MKYPTLKRKGLEKYNVTSFNEGFSQGENANNGSFSECENIYNSDGRICSRRGFAPVGEQYELQSGEYLVKPLITTETVYSLSGRNYRLAYMITTDYISRDTVKFYLAHGESGYESIGEKVFERLSASEFYRPTNIYFIVGNPTVGSGVYAFITREDKTGAVYEIYELSTDRASWENVNHKAYIPTIYANGRGTQFLASQEFDNKLDYPDIAEPEQRNLLTGCFKAYYSSDNLSYMFKLPLSNLDNNVITCRIYSTPESYTDWVINISEAYNTASFLGEEVTFRCNRQTGYFWFVKGGYYYPIPISDECPYNNIVITAHKSIENGMALVIGSKNAAVYNSRSYVYGNSKNPNEVFAATLTNPLYFPENAKATIGESTNGVTALGIQSGKLIAFKSGEIYKINVTKNSSKLGDLPIFDRESDFGKEEILESQTVHTNIGCDCPDTLRLCGNRLMWLNSNGAVYTLATTTYGKQNNIYEVSAPISKILKELPLKTKRNAFAVDDNGYYILMCRAAAFVMNYRVNSLGYYSAYPKKDSEADSVAWYIWGLPSAADFVSGFHSAGKLFINAVDKDEKICYTLIAQGDTDKLLLAENGSVAEKEYQVKSSLATKSFDFDLPEQYKYINAVYITANSTQAVEVTISGDSGSCVKRVKFPEILGTVRITPLIPITRVVKISVKTNGEFSLYGIRFEYTKCSKVG